jgi:hypothetical protein
MATRKLGVGDEDTVNTIDTNADGKPDVYVITDVAPQLGWVVDPPAAPPGAPFELGQGSTPDPDLDPFARTWRDRLVRP